MDALHRQVRMLSDRDVVEQLASIEIRPLREESRRAQLEVLASVLELLGVPVQLSSDFGLDHVNPDPSDDELFFAINEIVLRRFPCAPDDLESGFQVC